MSFIIRSILVLLLTVVIFLLAMLMWGVEYSELTKADKMIISLLIYLFYFRIDSVYPEFKNTKEKKVYPTN